MTTSWTDHDCLDIGADVNSMAWVREHLGVRNPLGLNIEPRRLQNMRDNGDACIDRNALRIPHSATFDFVSMSHFLEHLQDTDQVFSVLDTALKIARRGIYITGPYFEGDDYIRLYGVKFVWGDWEDHLSRFSFSTILPWLRHAAPGRASVSLGYPAHSTADDNIVALEEAPNLDSYARDAKLPKPDRRFAEPAYQEFLVFIDLSGDADPDSIHLARHGANGYKL